MDLFITWSNDAVGVSQHVATDGFSNEGLTVYVRQHDLVIEPAPAGFRGVSAFRTDAVTPALPIRE